MTSTKKKTESQELMNASRLKTEDYVGIVKIKNKEIRQKVYW